MMKNDPSSPTMSCRQGVVLIVMEALDALSLHFQVAQILVSHELVHCF